MPGKALSRLIFCRQKSTTWLRKSPLSWPQIPKSQSRWRRFLMGAKTMPDPIGIGYRRVKIKLDGLPLDQWDKLVRVVVYIGQPSGVTVNSAVLKAAIGPDLDTPSAGQKVAVVDHLFGTEGLYFVTTTLFFNDGKYLAQPVGNYDYLLATGIAEAP